MSAIGPRDDSYNNLFPDEFLTCQLLHGDKSITCLNYILQSDYTERTLVLTRRVGDQQDMATTTLKTRVRIIHQMEHTNSSLIVSSPERVQLTFDQK
jgi:hypothetical protein